MVMGTKKIGFIGLGIMGNPMAGHLVKAGHQVRGFDVVPAAVTAAAQVGVEAGASAQDVAKGANMVISMVPDSPDVEAVYLGEAGVLASVSPGTIWIISSAQSCRVGGGWQFSRVS